MSIVVYSLPICPNCDSFKEKLHGKNISFTSLNIEDDDVRMDLLMDCVTLVEAPIIKIGESYMDADKACRELGLCAM